MTRLFAALAAVALAVPLAAAPPTPAEQFKALDDAFVKVVEAYNAKIGTFTDDEARAKFNKEHYPNAPATGEKMMALADAHPADPAAVDALTWVVVNVDRPIPIHKKALDTLMKKHVNSDKVVVLAGVFEQEAVAGPTKELQQAAEAQLKELRATSTSVLVKGAASVGLAAVLKAKAEETGDAAMHSDAEKLATEGAAGVKADKEASDRATALIAEMKTLGLGKPMPALESAALDGKKVTLAELKGKVVVLDVWATWCGPCRQMIPRERELFKKQANKPFVLVSVSCDEKRSDIEEFLKKEDMPWTHWWDGAEGKVSKTLNVQFFPTIYVLDAKGVIRYKGVRGEAMDKAVDVLMKEVAK